MIFPTQHVYKFYVITLANGNAVNYVSFKEAQEFYSANLSENDLTRWSVKEQTIPCALTRTDKYQRDFCSHCEASTYTIEKWTDDIGHGMFRAFAILPNEYADRRANRILQKVARKHYESVGRAGISSVRPITGGAHVNVKPGYTEWTATYCL